MSGSLKSTSEDGTLILTLSNPEARNALGPDMYAAGIEALNAAENSAEIRTVIITGENNTFCAGGDLKRLQARREESADVQQQSIDGLHNWIDSIRTFPKPVIAAVEGAAAGAGFSLMLACDFAVAASDAVFVMSYSNVALSPDGGGSWALARALPRALASQWMMCGERLNTHMLAERGLINLVSRPGEALSESLELARKLNRRAPNALASIKELINDAPSQSLSRHLTSERDHFVRNLRDANSAEGIAAFFSKRPPEYR